MSRFDILQEYKDLNLSDVKSNNGKKSAVSSTSNPTTVPTTIDPKLFWIFLPTENWFEDPKRTYYWATDKSSLITMERRTTMSHYNLESKIYPSVDFDYIQYYMANGRLGLYKTNFESKSWWPTKPTPPSSLEWKQWSKKQASIKTRNMDILKEILDEDQCRIELTDLYSGFYENQGNVSEYLDLNNLGTKDTTIDPLFASKVIPKILTWLKLNNSTLESTENDSNFWNTFRDKIAQDEEEEEWVYLISSKSNPKKRSKEEDQTKVLFRMDYYSSTKPEPGETSLDPSNNVDYMESSRKSKTTTKNIKITQTNSASTTNVELNKVGKIPLQFLQTSYTNATDEERQLIETIDNNYNGLTADVYYGNFEQLIPNYEHYGNSVHRKCLMKMADSTAADLSLYTDLTTSKCRDKPEVGSWDGVLGELNVINSENESAYTEYICLTLPSQNRRIEAQLNPSNANISNKPELISDFPKNPLFNASFTTLELNPLSYNTTAITPSHYFLPIDFKKVIADGGELEPNNYGWNSPGRGGPRYYVSFLPRNMILVQMLSNASLSTSALERTKVGNLKDYCYVSSVFLFLYPDISPVSTLSDEMALKKTFDLTLARSIINLSSTSLNITSKMVSSLSSKEYSFLNETPQKQDTRSTSNKIYSEENLPSTQVRALSPNMSNGGGMSISSLLKARAAQAKTSNNTTSSLPVANKETVNLISGNMGSASSFFTGTKSTTNTITDVDYPQRTETNTYSRTNSNVGLYREPTSYSTFTSSNYDPLCGMNCRSDMDPLHIAAWTFVPVNTAQKHWSMLEKTSLVGSKNATALNSNNLFNTSKVLPNNALVRNNVKEARITQINGNKLIVIGGTPFRKGPRSFEDRFGSQQTLNFYPNIGDQDSTLNKFAKHAGKLAGKGQVKTKEAISAFKKARKEAMEKQKRKSQSRGTSTSTVRSQPVIVEQQQGQNVIRQPVVVRTTTTEPNPNVESVNPIHRTLPPIPPGSTPAQPFTSSEASSRSASATTESTERSSDISESGETSESGSGSRSRSSSVSRGLKKGFKKGKSGTKSAISKAKDLKQKASDSRSRSRSKSKAKKEQKAASRQKETKVGESSERERGRSKSRSTSTSRSRSSSKSKPKTEKKSDSGVKTGDSKSRSRSKSKGSKKSIPTEASKTTATTTPKQPKVKKSKTKSRSESGSGTGTVPKPKSKSRSSSRSSKKSSSGKEKGKTRTRSSSASRKSGSKSSGKGKGKTRTRSSSASRKGGSKGGSKGKGKNRSRSASKGKKKTTGKSKK